MKDKVDVVYVVASKLGTIGMGSTAYNALRGMERANLNYKGFCRGYEQKVELDKNKLSNYSFLEYLSYPFRFIEKFLKIRINSFELVNGILAKLIVWNLPPTKIYHSWMGIAPEAAKKAKKEGAILILEGANSHPLNALDILEKEYQKYGVEFKDSERNPMIENAKMVQQFDYIMCPSDFVYDSFLKKGIAKKRLIKLPYGVELSRFRNIKRKNTSGKFRAVFVGSIQLRKGIQYLLKAWEELRLRNAELVIVGRVWPDANEAIKRYKNNHSIKFAGFDNPEKWLSEADVFISPSLEEGSALTVYEAMASGLPIIATYNTGSAIRNGKEGFIIPAGDVKALKDKITFIYDSPKKAKQMGENAKKLAQKYSWKSYGDNLAKNYRRILNERQA